MKKYLIALIASVLTTANALPAKAQYGYDFNSLCTVQTRDYYGFVNVRYLPTIRSRVVATIPNQGLVYPLGKVFNEGYIWVGVRTREGLGFIRADYLSSACTNVPWFN